MPLYKGKDVPAKGEKGGGCIFKWYPWDANNDLLDWLIVKRTMEAEEKWSMQLHSHPDFDEYWFVIKGKGQIICSNKTYDVEVGDLFVTSRGVPHKAIGDVTFICCTYKQNVYGQTSGNKMQYLANNKPYRDNPSDVPDVGSYSEIDMSDKIGSCIESYNVKSSDGLFSL